MTDRAALYAAVLAAPADDLPRLVLADWLEEHGEEPRARYVRASCDLARLVAADEFDSDEYAAAVLAVAGVSGERLWAWALADLRRAADLERAADSEPIIDLVPAEDGPPVGPVPADLTRDTVRDLDTVREVRADLAIGFRRGFVAVVRCLPGAWLALGPGLTRAAPLERVELTGVRPYRLRPREWLWRVPGAAVGDARCDLPPDLFDRLPDAQGFVAVYASAAAAARALSVACLAYGRGDPAR